MRVPDLSRLPSAIGTVYPLGFQPKYLGIVINELVFDLCEPLTKAALDLLETHNTNIKHWVTRLVTRFAYHTEAATLREWTRNMLKQTQIPKVSSGDWIITLQYEYIEDEGGAPRIVPTLTARHRDQTKERPVELLNAQEHPTKPPPILLSP
jgi:hypothetical protein